MSQAFHGGRLREAQLKFGRSDFLDFSVNTNAFLQAPAPPPSVPLWDAISRYPDADAAALTQRLSLLHGVEPAHILPTAGAIEALYLATRLFAGHQAVVFQPAFADYARACTAAGVQVRTASLLPDPPSVDSVVETLHGADVVLLGNPNNPTGRLFSNLAKYLRAPALSHLAWIIDEAFIEFVPEPERHSLLQNLASHPNVIVLRAMTKSWSVPGLRLGFAATSNPVWMRQLRAWQPPWSVNGVAETWALTHLTPERQTQLLTGLRQLPEAREELATGISALPGLEALPSDANFLLVHTSLQSSDELFEKLGQQGFIVRICHGFEHLDQDRYVRVAVRSRADNARLLDALAVATKGAPRTHTARKAQGMRAISILGTSSNSGKSWVATAMCAWLRRRGLRVAPFKAQNMSNNSAVTADGGEIGRAQAVQAEACGLLPSVRMNPILLKPSGQLGSQLVRLGRAEGHIKAADYYKRIEELWPTVTESLSYWESRCEVLVLEGAGSPVELNLMRRDLVNLRPVRHLDSRWLLVADIERGGVFAQAAGTWALLESEDRARCAGLIVNKFRGDLSLFSDAARYFAPHFGAPLLGTLPYAQELQPESEDSLSTGPVQDPTGAPIHWIRFPRTSNSQDAHPWHLDQGVRVEWVDQPAALSDARVIVLPGTKDTLADLRWLKASGLATAILQAHQRGCLILGVCGGFQMLGTRLADPDGLAGEAGEEAGLGLLPVETWFSAQKEVRQVEAIFQGERWQAYEIHMGRSRAGTVCEPLLQVTDTQGSREEGYTHGKVWGTYLHGFFEASQVRREIGRVAGLSSHRVSSQSFRRQREALYNGMADLLEEHLNLEELWRYVAD